MKNIFLISLLIILSSCGKPKSVTICGDHVCINKAEAKKYFEENLTIEVKIVNKKKQDEIDLVQLNLNNSNNERKVFIKKKENTSQPIRELSSNEIRKIKSEIKEKNKRKKITKKYKKDNSITEKEKKNKPNDKISKKEIVKKPKKSNTQRVDVCTIIEKCSIEEISKYLINQGKKKDYPDITIKETRL